MAQKIIQAYHQAPWRIQVQQLGTFLLIILAIGMVTGFYLFISAQAAMAGLNIQDGEFRREVLLRDISSLKVQLSNLTSVENMEKRATTAGYKPVPADEGMYVLVKGYTGQPPMNMAPPPGPDIVPDVSLKPEYTQSLWEFLFQTVNGLHFNTGGQTQ